MDGCPSACQSKLDEQVAKLPCTDSGLGDQKLAAFTKNWAAATRMPWYSEAVEKHGCMGLEGAANRNELYLSWLLREKCGIENFQVILTSPYFPKCLESGRTGALLPRLGAAPRGSVSWQRHCWQTRAWALRDRPW